MEFISGREPATHTDTLDLWGAYGQLRDALKHIVLLLEEGADETVWDENLAAAKKILKLQ